MTSSFVGVRPKKVSQLERIEEYLRNGGSLTTLEAIEKFGCLRLADVVHRLRRKGLDVITDMVTDSQTHKTFASYRLKQKPQQLTIL